MGYSEDFYDEAWPPELYESQEALYVQLREVEIEDVEDDEELSEATHDLNTSRELDMDTEPIIP